MYVLPTINNSNKKMKNVQQMQLLLLSLIDIFSPLYFFRVRFFKNSVTCFYFFCISFSINFVRDYPSMQMLVSLSVLYLFFSSSFDSVEMFIFFSPYRESRMTVNTAVSYFFPYFFSYTHDTSNALGLSVSCLYIYISFALCSSIII
jgi:hypothetical protein